MALLPYSSRRQVVGSSTTTKSILFIFLFTSFAIFVLNVMFISHQVNIGFVGGGHNNVDSSLYSFVGTATPGPPGADPEEKDDPAIPRTATTLSLPAHKRFAYAFFATDEAYACGAFVNVASLRETGTRNETEFVILTYGFDAARVREQASAMNVVIKDVEHLAMPAGGNGYYQGKFVEICNLLSRTCAKSETSLTNIDAQK